MPTVVSLGVIALVLTVAIVASIKLERPDGHGPDEVLDDHEGEGLEMLADDEASRGLSHVQPSRTNRLFSRKKLLMWAGALASEPESNGGCGSYSIPSCSIRDRSSPPI